MIFLLLIVTKVVANTDGDFYAVQRSENDDFYVYTRIGNCAVYLSEILDRLFFQEDGIWKIGNLKTQVVIDEIDCKNISSFVEQPYQPFREPFIKIFICNLIKEGTITLLLITLLGHLDERFS